MKPSLFQSPWSRLICLPCPQRIAQRYPSFSSSFPLSPRRLLTTTAQNHADADSSQPSVDSTIADLLNVNKSLPSKFQAVVDDPSLRDAYMGRHSLTQIPIHRPHHLHVYATRHNCHITLTAGNRNPLISLSAGNIGFKKAQRGSYDAAYQLGIYVMGMINNKAMLDERYEGNGGQIRQLEVIWRDFGPGREAITKILLGAEGRALRSKIVRVMDGTRLKFGGTRSPKRRRLG